jgi:hypothetical protein
MTIVGMDSDSARIGTASSLDFAYWASTYVTTGSPTDYSDFGPETDGASLVSWAANQVGVSFPAMFSVLLPLFDGYTIPIESALALRGAILLSPNQIAVTMGLGYIVGIINGRFFQHKVAENLSYQDGWYFGAHLPGLIY